MDLVFIRVVRPRYELLELTEGHPDTKGDFIADVMPATFPHGGFIGEQGYGGLLSE